MTLEPDSWYVHRVLYRAHDGKTVLGWRPVRGKDAKPNLVLDGPFPEWEAADARCKDYVAARDVLQT